MAFKWECSECLKGIIVPYKSPQAMNGMDVMLILEYSYLNVKH